MKRGELKIDLNCDMGEVPEAIADGTQEALMRSITSVNIACGGHAGDEQTMKTTIEQALGRELAIGAQPANPEARPLPSSRQHPAPSTASTLSRLPPSRRLRRCLPRPRPSSTHA